MNDEFEFIKAITPNMKKQSSLVVGIGDDAAVYRGTEEYDEVICVDTMVEGIHFRKDTLRPYQVGFKALAVNVSDLAAMGAIPQFYLVSIAIPASWEEFEVRELYHGMNELALKYDMDLIGGDTVSTSDKLVITVTVIGRVEKGKALLRGSAKAGDVVFVTGDVGLSAAGLELLFKSGLDGQYTKEEQRLIEAHQLPLPQVKAGRMFIKSGFRIALNDISDGVASEAYEIAEASRVQLILEEQAIPLPKETSTYSKEKRVNWALYGGEEFQLIGTVSADKWEALRSICQQEGITLSKIGNVQDGETTVFLQRNHDKIRIEKKGYNHFKK
ncbi:thiamine-phosphate kinase [Bacillus alkalicellulosilyticus]|uniref:thiamine-phosphate kinase n=1 Tax=Alkalihalobacterium alkalicellulosilyticum TaxID=1912214 RepID=UPI0009968477|nr:thiamine-phosphate kinase [Bacillus alkalicellulosilyticus]